MFKKRELNMDERPGSHLEPKNVNYFHKQDMNTIMKGSKLTGDIIVTCDLELSGEVEGNINAQNKSNVSIKGVCRGNIRTEEGGVTIAGELNSGDIISGGNVKITGKFQGGRVESKGKIYLNGEFNGKLEGKEIEIGADSRGKGEILYHDYISIARGAKVEGQVSQIQKEEKVEKQPDEKKPEDMKVVFELSSKGKGEATVH
jgi:cytoskeletal protein CcmA (bactofilin family)